MNELQVWTLIGVFSAAILGSLSFGFAAFRNEMKNSVASLRGELQAMRSELVTKMESGFQTVNGRMDHLDRDVQYLMRKEFGENPSN